MPSLLVPEIPESLMQTIARRAHEAQHTLQDEVRLTLLRAYRDPRLHGQQVWMEMQREKLLRGRLARSTVETLELLRSARAERDRKIVDSGGLRA